MAYWLMKSEPDEFSIDDLQAKQQAPWDGVRNYQARNFIREMSSNDQVFFYHSSCKRVGIAGIMSIVGTSYADPLALDKNSDYFDEKSLNENRWSAINVKFETKYPQVLSLQAIKKLAQTDQRLSEFLLIKKGCRLSVIPVSDAQWLCLIEKANELSAK